MSNSSPRIILRNALWIAVPLSVVLTIYLYLYPIFQTCGFPLPPSADGVHATANEAFWETALMHYPLPKDDTTLSTAGSETAESGASVTRPTGSRPPLRNAPFRLLALGDPQLEGDTSIPNTFTSSPFPHAVWAWRHATWQTEQYSLRYRVRQVVHDWIDIFFEDIPNTLESFRKRIDLLGNDFYLAHIYRTLSWWTKPTHVTVLGDLLGSQWLDDDEFDRRADRFWSRVVRGSEPVPDELARPPADEYDLAGYLVGGDPRLVDIGSITGGSGSGGSPSGSASDSASETTTTTTNSAAAENETLSTHPAAWTRRVINIAGNHDVGYAGDINEERMARFERRFGRANYELRFELPVSLLSPAAAGQVHDFVGNRESDRLVPELRVVVLNDMNLDTPANSTELQDATYAFINGVINTASAVEFTGHFTLVLTHVPLHKPEGVCVDSPLFEFHEHDGTLREQNMLSADASRGFLEGILGMSGDANAPGNGRGRRGAILNGHDHAGCDTYHFINQSSGASPVDRAWESRRWLDAVGAGVVGRPGHPGVREITVRSMMGEFGGNAGLFSAWFDEASWEWRFEYATCPLGTQHLWWLVHILDALTVVAAVAYPFVAVWESVWGAGASSTERSSSSGKAASQESKKVNGATKVPSQSGFIEGAAKKEHKTKQEEDERDPGRRQRHPDGNGNGRALRPTSFSRSMSAS